MDYAGTCYGNQSRCQMCMFAAGRKAHESGLRRIYDSFLIQDSRSLTQKVCSQRFMAAGLLFRPLIRCSALCTSLANLVRRQILDERQFQVVQSVPSHFSVV
jgi:hypothetical protein